MDECKQYYEAQYVKENERASPNFIYLTREYNNDESDYLHSIADLVDADVHSILDAAAAAATAGRSTTRLLLQTVRMRAPPPAAAAPPPPRLQTVPPRWKRNLIWMPPAAAAGAGASRGAALRLTDMSSLSRKT